jgi:hypothetical protein
MTFGIYGIFWLSSTFSELQANHKKGISGRSYALLAVLFPPLAVSACWLLQAYVGRLYAENESLIYQFMLGNDAVFADDRSMEYLIISTGGSGSYGTYIMEGIVLSALVINIFLLYNWLKKIQLQINDFWEQAEQAR